MIGIPEASAAINGIKAAFGIAKGISALNSEAEINSAVIDIQRILLEAQGAALQDKETIAELQSTIRELRGRIDRENAWDTEKARYVLTESSLGAFTYDLDPAKANGEAPHRLCVTCFNGGRKSVLHTKAKHSGGEIVHCGVCNADLKLAKFSSDTVRVVRREKPWIDY